MIGLSVDDGPVGKPDASPRLYDFLKEQNQKISHFMIGANIRDNPQVFLRAFQELEDDIGVHTWSHPYMTALTNEQVVAEIGWTLQIIHDSTGGRVPRYWRPPYGDADNRVRAIASEVFGLTSVIWNRDTADWGLATNATTLEKIQGQFKEWLAGPRSPGLIVLEHEIGGEDVTAFINALPLIRQQTEWTAVSCAQLFETQPNGSWYLNAQNNTSPVTIMNVGGGNGPSTLSTGELGSSSSLQPASSSTTVNATGEATPADGNAQATATPPPLTDTPVTNPSAPVGAPPANTEVATNNEVTSSQPYVVVDGVGATSTTVVVANAPATGGATSANSNQITSVPNLNNAVAQPNAAGAAVGVPSHLDLSLVVAILSVVGGTLL
jgi:chitin deacetylase